MKRCPQCARDYNDDSLSFCLDDGSELLFGPSSGDEPATAIQHETAAPSSAVATGAHLTFTDPTTILPSGIGALPKRGLDKRLLAIAFIVGIVGAVYIVYKY